MRTVKEILKRVDRYRVRRGELGSSTLDGACGAFMVPRKGGPVLAVIASDVVGWIRSGMPMPAWEHVSVSTPTRCPTWDEMEYVKRIFWDESETVMQLHVPPAEHINHHSFCLHMWRPVGIEIPRPPAAAV